MNKTAASNEQFRHRLGSHSTKASTRGVNLLGWEESEEMTPEQSREAMVLRLRQIQTILGQGLVKDRDRVADLTREQWRLIERMREIRRREKPRDLAKFFMEVAHDRLPRPEFTAWVNEAKKRREAVLNAYKAKGIA